MKRTALRPSRGTVWPPEVREHVASHQPPCIGPLAEMPGDCTRGTSELDHIRGSGAMGRKSASIATNGARLCWAHHSLKTNAGRTWRPRLLDVVARLASECARCQRESIERYGEELSA